MSTKNLIDTATQISVLIIGVQTPHNKTFDVESYFQEFKNLVATSGIVPAEEVYTKLRTIDHSYFFTKGKLNELISLCEQKHFDEIIISEPLSTQQARNLKDALNAPIVDRTELILRIFEQGAQSAEGKVQVEMAILKFQKSRLAGYGIHLSQQGGTIGTKGPGETAKEKATQHLERSITQTRKELDQLEKVRITQRKRRLESKTPHIGIVGYTNAGKSTLLNTLTNSNILAENKLFATLDTTTRELFLNGTKKGTISDTVGFIQNLPHSLVAAFKSTLSELQYALLLLLVVDISDKNWRNHISVVEDTLTEIGAGGIPKIFVFNKLDQTKLTPEQKNEIALQFSPAVFISARDKDKIEELTSLLESWKPA
ncbi:MAG: GTPase HflX [candidate division TM6 bacterium GW2011_GWF2_43_17]|nr:MAG: GTPase HflX [candidate division TM6 bacterium GW2011_GWF2_43_17]HAU30166.1 GTPase HflX [Candidatus Dependentiae bacterium]